MLECLKTGKAEQFIVGHIYVKNLKKKIYRMSNPTWLPLRKRWEMGWEEHVGG